MVLSGEWTWFSFSFSTPVKVFPMNFHAWVFFRNCVRSFCAHILSHACSNRKCRSKLIRTRNRKKTTKMRIDTFVKCWVLLAFSCLFVLVVTYFWTAGRYQQNTEGFAKVETGNYHAINGELFSTERTWHDWHWVDFLLCAEPAEQVTAASYAGRIVFSDF